MASVDPAARSDLDALCGWRAWWLAARPRTLGVGAAPVVVGTAIAAADGRDRPGTAAAALACALLLQVGANLANDVFDGERGADPEERLGPPRALQLGLLAPHQLRCGALAAFGAAAIAGAWLVAAGGAPIALLGILAILAGLAYTGGPWPLGYHGLGDALVFAFFGVVATCGSYWVQALALPAHVVVASLPVGALATAVLVVNNIRDADTDRRAGKRTLAVIVGPRLARVEYAALLAWAYTVLPALWLLGAPALALLPFATAPAALRLARSVASPTDGPALNDALVGTVRLELVFCALLAAGWLAPRLAWDRLA